ncbi:MAG: hypothetical protein HKN85_09555 [Gammaproteobacteria bacterium]|nr:hypothetical protein [Gammaproteobacteria bacterium]
MDNSRFSSLVYRIIGKPEAWHKDYIDVMHQILDETDSFDAPDKISELAIGDQILSRLRDSKETLNAFSALLDKSRFKMIILDHQLTPIYHNQNAESLFNYVLCPKDKVTLRPGLLAQLRSASHGSSNNLQNELHAIDFRDQNGDQLYLRSIQRQLNSDSTPPQFQVLMGLDQSHEHNELNSDLVKKYELTEKEQMVVRGVIHGKSISEISKESFISENTVKTHLRAIFRKTDTNSQAAVVRLILTHESQILDSYFESEISDVSISERPTKDREVKLASGHRISYCEYGPKLGRPLVVFHSGYGCRLSIPPAYRDICLRTNRRLIIPDRPGIGKTPYIDDHPNGWNRRLREFIDILGLDRYDILGSILGCQLAINFAAEADHRLQKIVLNSPVIVNKRSHTKLLTGILSPTARLVRASRTFARDLYELWLKSITLNLGAHYRKMLESSLGSAERAQFLEDGTFEWMIDIFKEGASRSLRGISNEMVFSLTPMELDLSKITVPVEVWYGTEDQRISLDGVRAVIKGFPNHRLHVRNGYSEHIYYALFEEIIA